jgi:hypothetical protein
MTQRLDLTAVIATYNRGHLLGGVLAALAGQQTPPSLRWEVIVVDECGKLWGYWKFRSSVWRDA